MGNFTVLMGIGETRDIGITNQGDLAVRVDGKHNQTVVNLGRATTQQFDFLIECLTRLKIHAVDPR